MGRRGVTLIEIVVVLAIITIVGSFLLPQAGEWLAHFRLQQSARQIASDLRFAQAKALATGNYTTVAFNLAGGSYTIFDDGQDPDFVRTGNETEYKKAFIEQGIEFLDSTLPTNTVGEYYISFDPHGFPRRDGFAAGTITLKSPRTGEELKVVIASAGRIKISKAKK